MAYDKTYMYHLTEIVEISLHELIISQSRSEFKNILKYFNSDLKDARNYASTFYKKEILQGLNSLEKGAQEHYAEYYLYSELKILYVLSRVDEKEQKLQEGSLFDILAQISHNYEQTKKGLPVLTKYSNEFNFRMSRIISASAAKFDNRNYSITRQGKKYLDELMLFDLISHEIFNEGIDEILELYKEKQPQCL